MYILRSSYVYDTSSYVYDTYNVHFMDIQSHWIYNTSGSLAVGEI